MKTREIKFRAFHKVDGMKYFGEIPANMTMDGKWWYNELVGSLQLDADRCGWVFMQFTGLKDKNGKEIYEGDIIISDYDDSSCVCEWDNEFMCYMFRGKFLNKNMDEIEFELGGASYKKLKVIGNIYENPELLKP